MANVSWLIQRLKAMSIPEVLWRLSQKRIQKQEEGQFGESRIAVTKEVFNKKLSSLQAHPERMRLNYDNHNYELNTSIHLLAGADYQKYKMQWNAGFQTENTWPQAFSYKLEYKQRDDIGDARTNWELNRHFQFALLAKDYAASKNEKFLKEFIELFDDWNNRNPFLHGISWTSVMEVAIRCSNWCYAYAFFDYVDVDIELLEKLRIGIINMTDYVSRHYSRYSSANNHLIVEAFAIGQSGILFDHKEWIDLAVNLLTRELPIQNYNDGINKELSLHYQSFYMEAMGLMMRLLMKNGMPVPQSWESMLDKMSRYVADCKGEQGEVIVFGDNDEGKILDLQGGEIDHYSYVLEMMSLLLPQKYTTDLESETLRWLFSEDDYSGLNEKNLYISSQYCCYKEGGNTILRSKDRKVLIGLDHAELGFGSIAAHGHADALSFQLYYDGIPVFVDPGTFIYHCDLANRNDFRKTKNHNTVNIDGKDQSEMLGAFLWGRKAHTSLNNCIDKDNQISIVACTDAYKPIIHERTFSFDGNRKIIISDTLSDEGNGTFILNLGEQCRITNIEANIIKVNCANASISIESTESFKSNTYNYSAIYGIMSTVTQLECQFSKAITVSITISDIE